MQKSNPNRQVRKVSNIRLKHLAEDIHDLFFKGTPHLYCDFIRKVYKGAYWLNKEAGDQ